MAGTVQLLEYNGKVDLHTIDRILSSLKKNENFKKLDKLAGRRVYAIMVECLENIARYAVSLKDETSIHPSVSVKAENGNINITATNPVLGSSTEKLGSLLSHINALDQKELTILYDSKINNSADNNNNNNNGNGAGLGFMLMKLKSGNNLVYRFEQLNDHVSLFRVTIRLKQFAMRKLIIDQTSNSPRVIFDPDCDRYEISGESRPHDVVGFYSDILDWFDDYSRHLIKSREGSNPVSFNLDFEYFNSSSAKYILDFCKKMAESRSRGLNLTVRWHYDDDDTDMLEAGREMSKMAKFPFEFITRSKT